MPTVEESLEAQIRNIEEKYGKPLGEWLTIIKNSGKTKHAEIIALLKSEYGMSHGSANRIALKARGADSASIVDAARAAGTDPLEDMYSGKKAALKPIHDVIMMAVAKLGSDIEIAPKNGYVSLRHKKQFAMIQPTTATRIDVGLILKDDPITERLEAGSGFNAMFSHRVRVSTLSDVDEQLAAWLKRAYDLAG